MIIRKVDRADVIYDVPLLDALDEWEQEGVQEGNRPASQANRKQFRKTFEPLCAAEGMTRTGHIATPKLKNVICRYADRRHPYTGKTPSDISIKTFFVQAKAFCNFSWRNRYLASDSFYDWKRRKGKDPKIRVWADDHLATAMQCINDFWNPVKHPEIADTWASDEAEKICTRVAAIFCLFVASGLRREEVMALKECDLDRKRKVLIVVDTKTDGHREVPTDDVVIKMIDKMQVARRVIGNGGRGKRGRPRKPRVNADDYLFRNSFGEKMDGASTLRQIQRYLAWGRAQGMDMPVKFTLHALRHKVISAMLQINPEHARLMAGHKDISTTQRIYGHTLTEDVRETYDKASVINRLLDGEGFMVTFRHLNDLQDYAACRRLTVVPDANAEPLDLDVVERWLEAARKTTVDCGTFLNAWNLFSDLATTFQGRTAHIDGQREDRIYNKLFWGNNLPALTPPGKHYEPTWSKSEVDRMRNVLAKGMGLFRARLGPDTTAVGPGEENEP